MVTLPETIILSIIQGITEWLPVSSSGHFAIAHQIMSLQVPVIFDVCLHLGTLLSALSFFRKDVYSILKALARLNFKSREGRLAVNILLGGVPTALVGLAFNDVVEALFSNLLVVGAGLVVTGVFLLLSKTRDGKEELSNPNAVLIGLAQGIAAIPGLSRSGLTISVGVILGVEREKAFKYSFLLSIPTVIGATLLKVGDIEVYQVDVIQLMVGVGASALIGYMSLKVLTKIYQRKNGFSMFAPYCWLLGFTLLVATLMS